MKHNKKMIEAVEFGNGDILIGKQDKSDSPYAIKSSYEGTIYFYTKEEMEKKYNYTEFKPVALMLNTQGEYDHLLGLLSGHLRNVKEGCNNFDPDIDVDLLHRVRELKQVRTNPKSAMGRFWLGKEHKGELS